MTKKGRPQKRHQPQNNLILPWTVRRRLVPPSSNNFVCLPRKHIVSAVDVTLAGGITFICAPAGYGKTVISKLVYDRLRSLKWTCVWLTVGVEHRAVKALRQDLKDALSLANVVVKGVSEDCLSSSADFTAELRMLDTLHATSRPIALFIDGIDRMPESEGIGCLARMAAQLPPNVHLVVNSRKRSVIDLSRQRVEGNLIDIGPGELRITDEEVEKLLMGLVDRTRLQELVSSLDGWPAAVQQARAFLQRTPDAASFNTLLADGGKSLGFYIDEEVIRPLSKSNQEFLACAAELRSDSGELVDAALGRRDRYRVQAELAELDPLIRISANAAYSFQAHPAVGARLRRLPMIADARRDLHARAASWLHSRGDAPGAVKHLVAAGDIEGAAAMLERTGVNTLVSDLGTQQLRSLVRLVPVNALVGRRRARLAWIAVLLNDGRHEEAKAEFHRLTSESDDLVRADRAAFVCDIQLLENYFLIAQDSFPSAVRLEQLSQDSARVANAEPSVIMWSQQRADFPRAQRNIEEFAGIISQTGYRFDEACLQTYRGMIAFAIGNLDGAERAFSSAATLDPGATVSTPSLMIDVPRAELHYERDTLEAASDLLYRHDANRECLEDWFDIYVARHTVAARLLHIRGHLETAVSMLRNAATAARSRGLIARQTALNATLIEILMQAGEGPSAAQSSLRELPADLASIGEPDSLPWRLLDIVQMARARVTLAEGNASLSLVTVQELMQRWDTIGLVRGSIRTRLLAAAAHTRLGAERDANQLIFEALDMAHRTRHLRVLLDERMVLATSLTSFLQSASARAASTQLREWTNGLLRRLDVDEHTARSTPNSILSARERDVLIGLTRGKTNKMIALTCGITTNTVKHHLRHVYRKLKVRRRVQAIEEARRRALIP